MWSQPKMELNGVVMLIISGFVFQMIFEDVYHNQDSDDWVFMHGSTSRNESVTPVPDPQVVLI